MGRSSKEQAGANHRRIVEVADKLFRSRGYEAVGIADVMKAAGMTQGGFYKHFASKEALAVEAWKEGLEGTAQFVRQWEKSDSWTATIVDFYLSPKPPEYRCPMVAHGEEASRAVEGSGLRDVYSGGARSIYEAFMEGTNGLMEEDNARLLFAAMIGTNMLSCATDCADWLDPLKETVKAAAKHATCAAHPNEP